MSSPLNKALDRNWIAASAERERLERENADLRENNRKLALHTAELATEIGKLRKQLEAAQIDAKEWKRIAKERLDRTDQTLTAIDAAIANEKAHG